MTTKPDDAKSSLAERIEALGDQVIASPHTNMYAIQSLARAIAGELREIAGDLRQVYLEPCTACGARHLETYRTNTADRLARKEAP